MSKQGRPSERKRTASEREMAKHQAVQALHPGQTDQPEEALYQIVLGGQPGAATKAANPVEAIVIWAKTLPPEVNLRSIPSVGAQRLETF